MILYVIENFINEYTPLTSSSEDATYVLENLYNVRPSKPFRFTGQGSFGNPEWVCVDLLMDRQVTFCGIFNHNLDFSESAGLLDLKAANFPCRGESGAGNWNSPGFEESLLPNVISDFRNLCDRFNYTERWWDIDVIDQGNPYPIQFGEWVLGVWTALPNSRLQPTTERSPILATSKNITHYGQVWSNAYSEQENLSLIIKNIGDPQQIREMKLFLQEIKENNLNFVIIPNHLEPFCYYVTLMNESDFRSQIVRGTDEELEEWTMQLRTMTEGIALL